MNTDMILQTGLEVWREEFVRRERDMGREEIGHVSDRRLYLMALSGGIKDADAEDVSHLSLCPVCMGKWAKLRQAVSDTEDSEKFEDDRVVSWGMLEAAATDKPAGPLRLRSGCGNFRARRPAPHGRSRKRNGHAGGGIGCRPPKWKGEKRP